MTGEPGPGWDMHVVIASLRADRSDVESYARVLTHTLREALPEGMVEIDYRRSVADRMAGRPGQPLALRVRGDDRELELRQGKRGVDAEVRTVVRDVVISRKTITVDDWLSLLAEELGRLAERDATARAALARLLGG
ncbi:hypothetical protein [Amycolatopsis alkalitolerans]|uniref:Uncharacterized protein n=1 Tax=Amycolatopsis alkalitolerans TaxID=2547244 RepID=A0A5C4M788_9PSEU|nr:hypothetical protein [Amycolatopsis alkalitolerans]TNC29144.1 hypothetical protein FG385_03385 [Amycolatopsis alkalitolerans]